MKLGIRQLEILRAVGTTSALVVHDKTSKRLIELGLLTSSCDDGSFASITPAGLRSLADAAEDGRIRLFVMPVKQEDRT